MISMDFFSSIGGALFLIILSLYSYLFFWGARAHHKLNKPPEPGRAWPILGHLHLFRGSKLLHVTLSEIADKHGPIFSIRLGHRRTVVVSDWEVAKELATAHDKVVSSRPEMIVLEHLGYNHAMFAFSPMGSYWRKIKKLVIQELLSTRQLDSLQRIWVCETKALIQQLYKLWENHKDNSNDGVMVEMRQWILDITMNVNFMMIYGKRYSGDVEMEEGKKCLNFLTKTVELLSANVIGDIIPWLRWLDIGGYEKDAKETSKEFDHLFSGWLEEHYDSRRSSKLQGKVVEQDFMDVMISTLKDEDIDGIDAYTINKATCAALNIAGGQSVASLITWTLCFLINHPRVLKKVEEEVDFHVGKERNVESSDIHSLPYLEAVIKESLRLFPPAPLGGPREVTQDCVIGGYHVPAGTRLLLNIWKIQRDPKIWSEPLEFRPERFMSTHSNIDVRGQNFELIPFGVGRRICPGINFSLQFGRLVLASLVHSFHISSPNSAPVDMSVNEGLAMSKATPLEPIFTPKLSSHLYTT